MSRKKRNKRNAVGSPNPAAAPKQGPGASPQKQLAIIVGCAALLIAALGVTWWWLNRDQTVPLPKSNPGENPVVIIDTDRGKIKVELFPELAPITVKNFLQYVDDKHYDGTLFHRVIENFMIQGGGFTPDMDEKRTRPPIKNESYNGLSNERGTIAMARTNISDSASAQFFINVSDQNTFLDRANAPDGYGYAVFGNVIDGMDVVDAIRSVATNKGDRPIEDVVIKSVRRAKLEK